MSDTPVIERFFVCIGAQKAGTTWLARVLARHPEIFLTPVKEIHYFDHACGISPHLSDRKRRSRYRKYFQRLATQWGRWPELAAEWDWYRNYMRSPIDDAWYASLFKDRGGKLFAGEATPDYAIIGEEGLRRLRGLAPDARVLYILRNPVARTWSQVLHDCRRTRRDAGRLTAEELIAISETDQFDAHGDYIRVLDDLAAVFPPEQVRVEFYEDMHADRPAALARLCEFIGIGFDPAWFPQTGRRYNISQNVKLPDPMRAYLRKRYAGLAAAVEARLGRVPDDWREEFRA